MPPPPLTKRQQIVDALILRLKEISTSTTLPDGFTYTSNLGSGKIEEWPTQFDQSDCPALGIFDLDAEKPQTDHDEKAVTNTLPMQVRLFHKREDTPATLRSMLGDIVKALITDPATGEEDAQLGGLLVTMFSERVGFIVSKESFQIDGGAVGFNVYYLTGPWNEYE